MMPGVRGTCRCDDEGDDLALHIIIFTRFVNDAQLNAINLKLELFRYIGVEFKLCESLP